ncbi:MAG: hypothetical protein GY755_16675 [Chloroflexi bacterium]|nr:hypothetical protein [Chloroflexota bacterium]
MSKHLSVDKVFESCFDYFEAGEHQAAYDLLTEAAPHFPERAMLLYNWRYCAAALLDKPDLAIEIMQEAFNAGFWWSEEYLRSDDDLKILHDLPAFNQLIDKFEKRSQAAQASSKPFSLPLPLPTKNTETLPLLLALHGNTQNAAYSVEFWESAVKEGWLTVLLQSSQIAGQDAYVWDDLELGGSEIKDHYEEYKKEHSIDTEKVVVGGFSKGGEMAIWQTLMNIIPLSGFIAVNPGGPFIANIEKWLPLIENDKSFTDKRGYFVIGENDQNLENIKALHELFLSKGMDSKIIISPAIAHDFPADFDQILAKALKFIQD